VSKRESSAPSVPSKVTQISLIGALEPLEANDGMLRRLTSHLALRRFGGYDPALTGCQATVVRCTGSSTLSRQEHLAQQ
jgi:hypothetical protein